MKNKNRHIIKDQEDFFNQASLHENAVSSKDDIFSKYANKEQVSSFKWLSDCKRILDYGCGTGTSIDVFLKHRKKQNYMIYGVDIAQLALKKAKNKYPQYTFYKIDKNKIPQIINDSMDAAYMLHVLHHSKNHIEMFREIHSKLKIDGKFLINDLSSNNPINKTARSLFVHMPLFVKNRFSDDLVVGENIPEKYKVDIYTVLKQLQQVGFEIREVKYGHLFFFSFGWVDKFIPFSGLFLIRFIYDGMMKLENYLLRYDLFQKNTEVFVIKCIKK